MDTENIDESLLNGSIVLPVCPKCGAEDCAEHVKTEAHGIETHFDECALCGYRTDPE